MRATADTVKIGNMNSQGCLEEKPHFVAVIIPSFYTVGTLVVGRGPQTWTILNK